MLASTDDKHHLPKIDAKVPKTSATTDYCAKLQQWMWQYYWGGSHCHWAPASASPFHRTGSFPSPSFPETTPRAGHHPFDRPDGSSLPYPLSFPAFFPRVEAGSRHAATRTPGVDARQAQQQSGPPVRAGREYKIPSPLQRVLAEAVDFVILFCVKATVVLWIMHLSGMKDIAKFITQFIVEEIDENTTIEDLQKMMAVALIYRVLVCVYEAICIWGAGGATPGKFLLGLRVVTCDTSTLVQPNRVLVVPASNVSLSASTVRALNKNFSIAFLFPVFITLLFFQHNRAVYDVVAGTIVVQHREGR